eukprot:1037904-Pyramimonas_sp.AAC.1
MAHEVARPRARAYRLVWGDGLTGDLNDTPMLKPDIFLQVKQGQRVQHDAARCSRMRTCVVDHAWVALPLQSPRRTTLCENRALLSALLRNPRQPRGRMFRAPSSCDPWMRVPRCAQRAEQRRRLRSSRTGWQVQEALVRRRGRRWAQVRPETTSSNLFPNTLHEYKRAIARMGETMSEMPSSLEPVVAVEIDSRILARIRYALELHRVAAHL